MLLAWGAVFVGQGGLLWRDGGSPYYLVAGAALLIGLLLHWRHHAAWIHVLGLTALGTWGWAVWEVGDDLWALMPRVGLMTALLLALSIPGLGARQTSRRAGQRYGAAAVAIAVAIGLVTALKSTWAGSPEGVSALAVARSAAAAGRYPSAASGPADVAGWSHFGADLAGTRHSGAAQITPLNAPRLQPAWSFETAVGVRSGARLGSAMAEGAPGQKDEATPLLVDGMLVVCTPANVIVALDAEDGHELWIHDPKVDAHGVYWQTCRGVAHATLPGTDARAACHSRILTATTDARLIALDARTGSRCAGFGIEGAVSLLDGLGEVVPGSYYSTSPPTVAGGVAIVGAWVTDNVTTGQPSGVVRAYDVATGRLAWAWDVGRPPEQSAQPLADGATWTRGTPNAWSIFSADEALGLVYVPTGNATPDYAGAHRNPAWEPFGSAVVALDLKTGRLRWTFQTTHHDLWDYDVASQPVLFDAEGPNGPVPALLQATKRGELFVLDRRTGEPLTAVEERPVPATDVPGEWSAPTQPFSTGMPSLAGPVLTEADMWGLTPFDQLWCRREFHRLRYEGPMTPPSIGGSLQYPGPAGGVNWGSVSIDPDRRLAVVSSMRLAFVAQLFPRPADGGADGGILAQRGTPYSATVLPFFTRLRVPCHRPPYGLLTAIDLDRHRIAWQIPLGTTEESGPLSLRVRVPLPMGTGPNVGGAITTAGGVTFIGASTDRHLRAFDTETGEELWKARLPEGSQATPMTYQAPRSGRQMVVIVSGGRNDLERNVPMHVLAYALP